MKRACEIAVTHHTENLVGECPMWHPAEQALYWVDTRKPCIQRLDAKGEYMAWPMPRPVGSFVFRRSGGLVAGLQHGFCKIDLADGSAELVLDPEPHLPDNRLNDGRCDRRGRYWVGSRDPGNDNPSGSLYRLSPDFTCERMDHGFIVSNSMAFSPDDKTMIFGDSSGETVYRYEFDLDEGRIANRQVFLDTTGLPWRVDGATFDAEGYYWCALVGDWSVARFDPLGRLDRMIRLPVQYPTMCNFGGPDLDVLYVTSSRLLLAEEKRCAQPLAGALFAIRGLGVRGIAEPYFEG